MSEPGELMREAPPASAAPDVIHLPPPANDPGSSPGQVPAPQRKNGRAVSTRPGSQISRRRPVKDPLSARLQIRCSPQTQEKASAASIAAGLSISAWVCSLIDGVPPPRAHCSKPGPEAGNTARIMAALGRSGNNLNQLLQKVDAYDFRGMPVLLDMAGAMKAANAAHHELVAAIKAKLDRRKRLSRPGPDTDTAARIVADLRGSGNDLNQLLQKVNAYDFRGHPELLEMAETMKAAHAAHHELVAAIRTELGI